MGKKKEKNLEIGSLVPIYAQFAEHLRVLMSEQRFVRGLSVDCLGLLNIPVDGLDAYIKSRQEQGKGLLSVEDLSCLLGMSSQSLRKILNAHTLRHTFSVRALELGFDVKTLSEILGHADATITLRTYAHSLDEHKRNSMAKFTQIE